MSKKKKSYRGQRDYKEALHSPCGCFYCTGYSKADKYKIKCKAIDRDITNPEN